MPSKKEDNRRRANERQEARAKRTPQEQLMILDERFGEGKGAVRERARLTKLVKVSPASEAAAQMKTAGTLPQLPGMGALPPPELTAKVKRFAKQYMDGENIHAVGLGAGKRGHSIHVIASNPEKANLPNEFEGMEVVVLKGGPPIAA